jgi:hypothetical protein
MGKRQSKQGRSFYRGDIHYAEIVEAARSSGEGMATYFRKHLLYCCRDRYLLMTERPTDIIVFSYGTFEYVFDAYQQQEPYDPTSGVLPIEARLVVAVGTSKPKRSRRDDGRLRGLTASAMPGIVGDWDRGHCIAHSIGGTVDGNEANVFLQLRSINRGKYRTMENYCRKFPGVTCFSRPIYADTSAHPVNVEFGVLKTNGELWVDVLPNRPDA